jgi:hypothetical protein
MKINVFFREAAPEGKKRRLNDGALVRATAANPARPLDLQLRFST